MNYREEAITDERLISRLTTGPRHSVHLSEELSRMEIVSGDKSSSSVGLFSRIKSTIFSSQESTIRCQFVASCKLETPSDDELMFVGIKSNGSCTLLKANARSERTAATEVTSISLPSSQEGYCIASLTLGRTQGSLCAASAGEGRIILITVKADLIGVKKNITLPITAPITGLFLNERGGLIELFVVLESSHIVVIPDITKTTEYFFVFTKGLKQRIKLMEFASITDDSIEAAWERRSRTKAHEHNFLHTSCLVSTKLNSVESLDEFKAVLLHEKAVELALLRHPTMSISSLARADSLARIKRRLLEAKFSLEYLIDSESENLESHKISFEISNIEYDAESGKIVIHFIDGHVSEIVPTHSVLERHLNTFLSASFVFRFLNQRLSRDSVLNLHGASKEWVNLFACASVAEAIGSSYLDILGDAQLLKSRIVSHVTGPIKEHIEASLNIISYVSKEKRIELIESLISSETNSADLATRLPEPTFNAALGTAISNILRLSKYYVAYATYTSMPVRHDIEKNMHKLVILNHIFTHYFLGPFRDHLLNRCKIASISDLINKMELVFCAPSLFAVDVGYLSATTDVVAHSGFRKFHLARFLASSPVAHDRDRAWELVQSIDTEMSLMVDYLVPATSQITQPPSLMKYYMCIQDWFAGDYKQESAVLTKLSSLSTEEGMKNSVQKSLIEKAIAHGDWARTKALLGEISRKDQAFKQHAVRLVCTEARIRNELAAVFDLVKDNRDVISLIVHEIELELANRPLNESEELYMQIYSLSAFVEDYIGALRAMYRWYLSLTCIYTSESASCSQRDLKARLDLQLKALLLCRSIFPKIAQSSQKDIIVSLKEVKKRIVFVEGLIALNYFLNEEDETGFESILDESTGCVSPSQLCRTLSALGLCILAFHIATMFKLDLFKTAICPLIELVIKCEDDPSYLPPCRWEDNPKSSVTDHSILLPRVIPSMSFVRSDASGPIRAGGSQLRALYQSLELVVQKAASKRVTLEAIEYVFLVKNRQKIYTFLVDIIESQNGWTDLLKVYMRKELYRDCVRLVETHIKFWRPSPTVNLHGDAMIINVPLLVQLQRAIRIAEAEGSDKEMTSLCEKLDITLDGLKSTLADVSQRLI